MLSPISRPPGCSFAWIDRADRPPLEHRHGRRGPTPGRAPRAIGSRRCWCAKATMRARNAAFVSGAGVYRSDEALTADAALPIPQEVAQEPPARSTPSPPPRGRTSSILPTTPAGARTRSSASPGTNLTRPAASSGSRPRARRRWWGGSSRSRSPSPRHWRGGGHAAIPTARSSSTATESPSAVGVGSRVVGRLWP